MTRGDRRGGTPSSNLGLPIRPRCRGASNRSVVPARRSESPDRGDDDVVARNHEDPLPLCSRRRVDDVVGVVGAALPVEPEEPPQLAVVGLPAAETNPVTVTWGARAALAPLTVRPVSGAVPRHRLIDVAVARGEQQRRRQAQSTRMRVQGYVSGSSRGYSRTISRSAPRSIRTPGRGGKASSRRSRPSIWSRETTSCG